MPVNCPKENKKLILMAINSDTLPQQNIMDGVKNIFQL